MLTRPSLNPLFIVPFLTSPTSAIRGPKGQWATRGAREGRFDLAAARSQTSYTPRGVHFRHRRIRRSPLQTSVGNRRTILTLRARLQLQGAAAQQPIPWCGHLDISDGSVGAQPNRRTGRQEKHQGYKERPCGFRVQPHFEPAFVAKFPVATLEDTVRAGADRRVSPFIGFTQRSLCI